MASKAKKNGNDNGKPPCKLIGQDGNVFAIIGRASRALKDAGQSDKATEMQGRAMTASSYDEALQIVMAYVEAE